MTRRESERIGVRWPIRYERLRRGEWSKPQEAVCLNVGGQGMMLLVNERLEQGELLRLHMRDVNRDLPYTLARVRWSKLGKEELEAARLAGVEYVYPLDTDFPDTHRSSEFASRSES